MKNIFVETSLTKLKSSGWSVDIIHARDYLIAYKNETSGKIIVEIVRHVPEFMVNNTALVMLTELLPHGGRTELRVTDPVTGTEFYSESICRNDENFCRSTGIEHCLTRLFELLAITDGFDGFITPPALK